MVRNYFSSQKLWRLFYKDHFISVLKQIVGRDFRKRVKSVDNSKLDLSQRLLIFLQVLHLICLKYGMHCQNTPQKITSWIHHDRVALIELLFLQLLWVCFSRQLLCSPLLYMHQELAQRQKSKNLSTLCTGTLKLKIGDSKFPFEYFHYSISIWMFPIERFSTSFTGFSLLST